MAVAVMGVASAVLGLATMVPADAPHGPASASRGATLWQTEQDADYLLRRSSGNWAAPQCVGDGVKGRRVQPVFVYREGYRNRFPVFQKIIERSMYLTTGVFERSSEGLLTPRWVHDPTCQPQILQVAVPKSRTYYLSTIRSYLKRVDPRFRKKNRVYALWVDAKTSSSWSGLGDRRWAATWSSSFGFVWADTHELVHALGAVNPGAPHSTGKGHCYDAYDIMCYSDGGPTWRKLTVCPDPNFRYRLDCGGDDYFALEPKRRSWLAKHPKSNVAYSRFLKFTAPRILPVRPPAPVGVSRDAVSVDWVRQPGMRYDVGYVTWSGTVKWLGQDITVEPVDSTRVKPKQRLFVRAVNDAGYSNRAYAPPLS